MMFHDGAADFRIVRRWSWDGPAIFLDGLKVVWL